MRILRSGVSVAAAYRCLGVLTVLIALELLSRTDALSSRHFPPVSETFRTLADQLDTLVFWSAVGATLQGWAVGLAIAFVLAIPSGILIGSSRAAYRSLRVLIEFLRPIPSVALIPLIVLLFGSGLQSKVFLAAFASFWPLLIQTIYGVQDVDPVGIDTARSFGLGPVERFMRVSAPSAVPYIATGLRISSATALVLSITAEIVIGTEGLGRSINAAREGGAVDVMYALLLTAGLLGLTLNSLVVRVERGVLHWHPSHRVGQVLS